MSFRTTALAQAARYLGKFKINPLAHRYSFNNNEYIDEMSERFLTMPVNGSGGVPYHTVTDEKVNLLNSTVAIPLINDFTPRANTPFSIQAKFNVSSIDATYGFGVVSKWHEQIANERSWMLSLRNDRSVAFHLSPDGTDASIVIYGSAANVFQFNVDNHICVERTEDNLLRVYVNGTPVISVVESRGAFFNTVAPVMIRRGGLGKVWDIAMSHNAVFKGPFQDNVPGDFAPLTGNYIPRYENDVAADIVFQWGCRRASPMNEVNGSPIALNRTIIADGKLVVVGENAAYYSSPVGYFGAGDFTMECKIKLDAAISGEGIILMSHWYNGGYNHSDNRYTIVILPNMALQVVFANSSQALAYTVRSTPANIFQVNKKYHIVVERFNGIIKVFVNGTEYLSWSQPAALWATSGNRIDNRFNGTGYGQHRIWDIRIAKRAMYKHISPVWPEWFPKLPVDWRNSIQSHRLITGSDDVQGGGILYRGFAKNFQYGSGTLCLGDLPKELYYNTVTGKVTRIVAIFNQANGYYIIVHEPTNLPYSPDLPTMTNTLSIDGRFINIVSGGSPLTNIGNPNHIARYFPGTLSVLSADEMTVGFSFV